MPINPLFLESCASRATFYRRNRAGQISMASKATRRKTTFGSGLSNLGMAGDLATNILLQKENDEDSGQNTKPDGELLER
jgi:hypothetical protein